MAERHWQRYGLWISVGIAAVLITAYLVIYLPFNGEKANLKNKDGLLIVNHTNIEMAFHADNGAIAYVRSKGSEESITQGNREQALWWAFLKDDSSMNSAKSGGFSYDWNKRKGELVFHYRDQLQVDVTVRFSDEQRVYLDATVLNGTEQVIKSFRFPYEVKVTSNAVMDGMLPMLPGAKLKDTFFKESNSYQDQYPGVMFANYLGLRTTGGHIAMYDLVGTTLATTELGFKNQVDDVGKTGIVHNYKTWINPQKEWKSPTVVIELGEDYKNTIVSYRKLNGIDKYRSLDDKLGAEKATYFQLPLYKTDISAIKDGSWNHLSTQFIDRMNYNGIVHLVGFQSGGHDENYPDFIPPDAKWGGDADFQAFMKHAKDKGNRVVPYTNMSWWGNQSPTLANLPSGVTMEDIVVLKENNTIMKEDYGKHSGYVVNPGHPFFIQRTAEEHKKLLEEAGFDGIFEDQWGIRNSPFVFNEVQATDGDPSTAYFQGVMDYFNTLKHNIYIEDGTDVLADDTVGFMGSTLLWDRLGYRKNTASYTDYYPLAGMLMRDKVLFYHHDLAAETMTDDPDMLRWNLAMGYNLSADFYNGVTNPWVDAIGVLQKYILSQYTDSLVENFEQLTQAVTRTDFGQYTVTANEDQEAGYLVDSENTLAPGGYAVISDDGSRKAGRYSRYNGLELDAGEHHLVEIRDGDSIRIYQPIGSDTTLKIKMGKDWPHVRAVSYQADGTEIAELPVKEEGGYALFDYIALIKEQKVGYVEFTSSEMLSKVTGTPYEKVKAQLNLALLKQVDSTADAAKEFPAELTVDGDPYTYWESVANKFPQSLTIDLGEERNISKLILRLPPQDAWEVREQEIAVLLSGDGKTYTKLLEPKPYAFDPVQDNKVEIVLGESRARYVRLTLTGNTAWPAAQISEFEVY
jgi:hypothetical protein